jgi:predicted flap endonuclease-1-like 5' DNA nuclease
MDTLLILVTQSKIGAILEILSLLLVAAIIGYITAWLFYKSVYARRIKAIVSDKDELNKQITILNTDKSNLHKSLREKDNEMEHLVMEVNALKALHAEAVNETDDMTLKNKRTEQLLYEKDEAWMNIAQGRQLLDYKSFGTATKAEKDDLKMISGIGPFIEERLHALAIYTFRQISKFTARDIETINDAIEYFSGRIERDEWVAQAKELVHSKDKRKELLERIRERKVRIYYKRIGMAKKEEADDLTIISGIGGWIMEKLNALDIYTFKQISNLTEEDVKLVTDVIEYFPGRIERDEWIPQAQELVRIAGKKYELLKRISDRKERIYYERVGVARKHQANNLTLIKGIGLWIEERLNMLDIYTFKQISKLTPADVETITEILEISPGRIDRDNWVSQAQELAKKQLHKEIS